MPRDECCDCEHQFPGGDGLIDGRCRSCRAAYLARTRTATPKPTKAHKDNGKEK